jgi:hypothetical protein
MVSNDVEVRPFLPSPNKTNEMAKINIGMKFEETTIAVVKALLEKPENLKLKDKFNPMVEHLIETHPEFIEMKKELDKKKPKLKR